MLPSSFLIIFATLISQCTSTLSPGFCPYIEPIENFDMTKFLGLWYSIQDTGSRTSCLTYEFKEGEKDGEYLLDETSEGYVSRLRLSYVLSYTGVITAEDDAKSKMTIKYPLSVGSSSFNVITTDYKTYAGIQICQNVLFFKRQSSTLLSRTKQIDEIVLKQMRLQMYNENFDDLLLKDVKHDSCLTTETHLLVKINTNSIPTVQLVRAVENADGLDDAAVLSGPDGIAGADGLASIAGVSDAAEKVGNKKMDQENGGDLKSVPDSVLNDNAIEPNNDQKS